jgi:hypothetical protein
MLKGFSSFKDILKNEPGLNNVRRVISQSDVVLEFSNIFPDLSKVAAAVKVERKMLYLKVENPAWRNELRFKESFIVKKINDFFGEARINQVKFLG